MYPSLLETGGRRTGRRREAIRLATARLYEERSEQIGQAVAKMQALWDHINRSWMLALSEILETDWGSLPRDPEAYVGLSPLCPRSLEERRFTVPYYAPGPEVLRICAHEIVHFLYSKKLQSTCPGLANERLDYPHREWLLSEILAPIILSDPRAVRIIGRGRTSSYVCDNALSDRFRRLYDHRLRRNLSFDGFLELASALPIRAGEIAPAFGFILGSRDQGASTAEKSSPGKEVGHA